MSNWIKKIKSIFGNKNEPVNEVVPSFQHAEETTKCEQTAPKDDYPVSKLVTRESPQQILSEDFPDHSWPISGGWGYNKEDAVVVELDNPYQGVPLEYKFIQFRTYEELTISRPNGQKFFAINFAKKRQALIYGKNGKQYDRVEVEVTALTEGLFALLKTDWESHNGYEDDPEGKKAHLEFQDSKSLKFTTVCWFDISNFIMNY